MWSLRVTLWLLVTRVHCGPHHIRMSLIWGGTLGVKERKCGSVCDWFPHTTVMVIARSWAFSFTWLRPVLQIHWPGIGNVSRCQIGATQATRLGGYVHVQVDLGKGDEREVGTGKVWRLGKVRWTAGNLWAELAVREIPGLVKWKSGDIWIWRPFVLTICPRWSDCPGIGKKREDPWTGLTSWVKWMKPPCENISKPTPVYSMPAFSLLSRLEWGCRETSNYAWKGVTMNLIIY